MKSLMLDFKKFLLQSNLVTLAVAVIVGTIFAALVKALIADLITPIIALVAGKPSFGALSFTINGSHFRYGDFLNELFTFITTAAAVFFLVVRPYQFWDSRRTKEDPSVKECPECLTKIPSGASRCFACTAQQPATA